MEKLENKIIKEIQNKDLKPKSKLFFFLRNYTLILFSIALIILTSLALSSIFYQLSQSDLDLVFTNANFSLTYYIFVTLPYFWFVLGVVFLVVFSTNFRKTKRNYRYPIGSIFAGAFLVSLVLGTILHVNGLSKNIENLAVENIYIYKKQKEIQSIQKDLFLIQLKENGVTPEMIAKDPELKNRIRQEYIEKVLRREYVSTDIIECKKLDLNCTKNENPFSDKTGCGCVKK